MSKQHDFSIEEVAEIILFAKNPHEKMFAPPKINFNAENSNTLRHLQFKFPDAPGRPVGWQFSDQKIKFPKSVNLENDQAKAVALHFFANHELLAIEIMCAVLLMFPSYTEELKKFKKAIYHALLDEQKHFMLYENRMQKLGYTFGDFPVNDFFWRMGKMIETPAQYCAVMSLTFEAANLDFAHYYRGVFSAMGDAPTAGILQQVFDDEISHVKLGWNFLNQWKNNSDIWQYYCDNLPFPVTPKRAMGIDYQKNHRLSCGISQEFIAQLESFEDSFRVTNRKNKL